MPLFFEILSLISLHKPKFEVPLPPLHHILSAGVLCRYPSDFLLCLREKKGKRKEEEKRKREKREEKDYKYKSQLSSFLPLSTYSTLFAFSLLLEVPINLLSCSVLSISHELVEFMYFWRMRER